MKLRKTIIASLVTAGASLVAIQGAVAADYYFNAVAPGVKVATVANDGPVPPEDNGQTWAQFQTDYSISYAEWGTWDSPSLSAITEIPTEQYPLSVVTSIGIDQNVPNIYGFRGITEADWIYLEGMNMPNFLGLHDLTTLTSDIYLSNVTGMSDFTGMGIVSTPYIGMDGTSITSMNGSKLETVDQIDFGNTLMSDVSGATSLRTVGKFDLTNTSVASFDGTAIESLNELILTGTPVTDISALSSVLNVFTLTWTDFTPGSITDKMDGNSAYCSHWWDRSDTRDQVEGEGETSTDMGLVIFENNFGSLSELCTAR